jgi:hypothetical protein
LGEGGQGAGGGIAEGAQRCQQYREEDMNPLMGCALPHAEQAALHHLERRGLQVDQHEEQAIFRRRERTVFVHRAPAGGPRFPIEAPRCEMCLERCLKGRNEALKLVERETGQIQELCGAGLHVGEL